MVGSWIGRRAGLVVALVAVLALVTGACSAGNNPLETSPIPTTASNHRLAVVETARLLASVALPSGTERSSSAGSRLLDQPGNGTLSGATDGRRYWRVHEAYSVAVRWIEAHAPAGSQPGGITLTQGSKVISTVGGYIYLPPSSAAWQSIQLSVEATAIGPDDTAVRADAQVQWLDPTPYPDQTPGPRFHVAAEGRCPASVGHHTDVTNAGTGLRAALLPPGRVTSVLVCRYGSPAPSNHPDLHLTLTRRLGERAMHYLVAKTKEVVVAHPTAEPPPACEGLALSMVIVVAYGYPGGRSVDLWLEPTHCTSVEDNGSIEVPLEGRVYAALQLTVPGIGTDG